MKYIFLFIFFLLSITAFSQDSPNDKIYEPERLIIINNSEVVSGTVMSVYSEIDGDYHIRLKMDSDYVQLSRKNYTKQDSCIVLEIVCAHKTLFSISCTCGDYQNQVPIPNSGDHIRVFGTLVFDKRHKWIEIHPVIKWNYIIDNGVAYKSQE